MQLKYIVPCALLLSACTQAPQAQQQIGMPNPASAYCESIGGQSKIQHTPEGEVGICHLPDGTDIEEWALFRRDHPAK